MGCAPLAAAPEAAKANEVTVVGLGGEAICQVRVSTVRELKQEIERLIGVEVTRQELCCSEMILRDEDLLLNTLSEALADGSIVVQLAVRASSDEEINEAAERVNHNPLALKGAPEEVKGDYSIVLAAVQKDGHALQFASDEMQSREDIVIASVRQKGTALRLASEGMKKNAAVLLAAFEQMTLKFSQEERGTAEAIVLAAVKQNGAILQCVSEAAKNTEAIVMAAVRQDGRALEHASEEMKDNEAIVMAAIQQRILACGYLPSVLSMASKRVQGMEHVRTAAGM